MKGSLTLYIAALMCVGLAIRAQDSTTKLDDELKQEIEDQLVFNATNASEISACYDAVIKQSVQTPHSAKTHLKLAQCLNSQIVATYNTYKSSLSKEDEKDIFRRSKGAATTRKMLEDYLTVAHYHLSLCPIKQKALDLIDQILAKMETDHCAQCYESKIGVWIQEAIDSLADKENTETTAAKQAAARDEL